MCDDTTSGGVERPSPEDDPHACSVCGQPLGTTRRVRGDDLCWCCEREYAWPEAAEEVGSR